MFGLWLWTTRRYPASLACLISSALSLSLGGNEGDRGRVDGGVAKDLGAILASSHLVSSHLRCNFNGDLQSCYNSPKHEGIESGAKRCVLCPTARTLQLPLTSSSCGGIRCRSPRNVWLLALGSMEVLHFPGFFVCTFVFSTALSRSLTIGAKVVTSSSFSMLKKVPRCCYRPPAGTN